MATERRKGMKELHGQVGYITGVVEKIDERLTTVVTAIEKNADSISAVSAKTKDAHDRIDKYRNRLIGGSSVGTAVAWIMIKWDALASFFGGHHG